MAVLAFLKRNLVHPRLSLSVLILFVTSACAAQGQIPFSEAEKGCADSVVLNQEVWSDNGIERRQALRTLGACGLDYWNFRVLMAPLTEIKEYNRPAAWINIHTALDPLAAAKPERITDFLLARAGSSDPEERRLAILALGGLLGSRFSISSLNKSQTKLLRGLNDPDYRVRRTAAEAFGGFLQFGISSEDRSQLPTLLRPLASALVSRTSDSAPEVRAASVKAMSNLARLEKFDGIPQPLVTTDQLLSQLEQRLSDSSAEVRLEAVKALQRIDDKQLSPAQWETKQQWLILLIQDQDFDVAVKASADLDETKLPQLVNLIRSGRISPTSFTAMLLDLRLIDFPAGYNLLQDLLSSPEISFRVNAQRAINGFASRADGRIPNDQAVKSKSIFGLGLRSSDPATQIDAISGLSELDASSESIALLRPSLSSPLPPVRWAAAIAISQDKPKDETTFNILREILESSSDDDLRRTASESLERSQSPSAARIIGQTAQKKSRELMYVRSCNAHAASFPKGQYHVGVDSMIRPACRRAVADSFSYTDKRYESDVVNALLRVSESGDDDLRFNAIYALGSMAGLGHTETTFKPKLNDRITALLLPITSNQQEHPEVRRIAATMLHLNRQPIPEFFSDAGLSSPATACSNALEGRREGFAFDPYEGRCMYDTRTGCGDGLSEVYSTLRRMLGQRKAK